MNKYFISYMFQTIEGYGFGNGFFELQHKISSFDDVLQIEKQLQTQENFSELPIIISYKEVYDE